MFEKDFLIDFSSSNFGGFLFLHKFFYYGQEIAIADTNSKNKDLKYFSENNMGWVYLSWNAKIHKYPKYDEKIIYKTAPISYKGYLGFRGVYAVNEQNEILFEAEIQICLLDLQNKKMIKLQDGIMEEYKPFMDSLNFECKKIPKKDINEVELVLEKDIEVLRHDTDTNFHTNNISYIKYAESCIPKDLLLQHNICDVFVNYKKETYEGDIINLKTYYNKNTKQLFFDMYKENKIVCKIYMTLKEMEK